MTEIHTLPLEDLRTKFGSRLQLDVPLAKYTSARIGGPADALITAESADELVETVNTLWQHNLPYLILGGGSNVLVSDAGYRGVLVLNKARKVVFSADGKKPTVTAEAGANFGVVARQAAQKGLSGLEWAAGIPGTVGGAVYGNAGAHGSELADNLELAEVLHPIKGRQEWLPVQFKFGYRTSALKKEKMPAVVLSATLHLEAGRKEDIQQKLDEYLAFRRRTQPPGASMGSMFKNPEGDYAGRLIDGAGLKGTRIGQAEISQLHANFFINHGEASAEEVYNLIQQARKTVMEKFGISLDLEIQLVGDFGKQTR